MKWQAIFNNVQTGTVNTTPDQTVLEDAKWDAKW